MTEVAVQSYRFRRFLLLQPHWHTLFLGKFVCKPFTTLVTNKVRRITSQVQAADIKRKKSRAQPTTSTPTHINQLHHQLAIQQESCPFSPLSTLSICIYEHEITMAPKKGVSKKKKPLARKPQHLLAESSGEGSSPQQQTSSRASSTGPGPSSQGSRVHFEGATHDDDDAGMIMESIEVAGDTEPEDDIVEDDDDAAPAAVGELLHDFSYLLFYVSASNIVCC